MNYLSESITIIEILIISAINIGVVWQRTRTLEKASEKHETTIENLTAELRASVRQAHERINDNSALINQHQGILDAFRDNPNARRPSTLRT